MTITERAVIDKKLALLTEADLLKNYAYISRLNSPVSIFHIEGYEIIVCWSYRHGADSEGYAPEQGERTVGGFLRIDEASRDGKLYSYIHRDIPTGVKGHDEIIASENYKRYIAEYYETN